MSMSTGPFEVYVTPVDAEHEVYVTPVDAEHWVARMWFSGMCLGSARGASEPEALEHLGAKLVSKLFGAPELPTDPTDAQVDRAYARMTASQASAERGASEHRAEEGAREMAARYLVDVVSGRQPADPNRIGLAKFLLER